MKLKNRDFSRVKRLVVKVGSSSLAHATGKLNLYQFEQLAVQLADLHNQGKEILLVTSGAVGAGLGKLGLRRRPKTMPEKQAAAAVGQGVLMQMYEKFFAEYGVTVGQVLLSREDFSDRRRFLNARNTMYALLGMGVIPIINENDTVSIEEIRLGDNDTLSALVTGLVDAELLVLLSDIDGVYTADPRKDPAAVIISEIDEINEQVESLAGGAGSGLGTGGMTTKLQAAKIAMRSGAAMVIARAAEKNIIRRVVTGEPLGTVFCPGNKLDNKKHWIMYSSAVQGKISIDEGASRALVKNGKSLLPSGVVKVEGVFEMGNTVCISGPDGRQIARGITNYASEELKKIMGKKTSEIAVVLGSKDYDEVIHRNNLVLDC
jgi:glutamate 5-kinase